MRTEMTFNLQRFTEIENSTADTLVSGTDAADSIANYASGVTIVTGAGNDYVSNNYYRDENGYTQYSNKTSVVAGEGDDTVYNYDGDSITVDGGAGNDSIYNWGERGTLFGGADRVKRGDFTLLLSRLRRAVIENGGTIGASSGNVICRKHCQAFPPSMEAAS